MTGPYREALRLPYAEWERAMLADRLGEERARHLAVVGVLNRVWNERVQPALDQARADMFFRGAGFVKFSLLDDDSVVAEAVAPADVLER